MMKQYHLYVLPKTAVLLALASRTTSKLSQKTRRLNSTLSLLKRPRALVRRLRRSYRWNSHRLVVVHETVSCDYDEMMGYEFCDLEEESVERFVGANSIIEHLQATLDAYTYAHTE